MQPMLATPGRDGRRGIPTGPEWCHEVKWDGVRILAEVTPGLSGAAPQVRFATRNGNDATVAWPDVVAVAPQRSLLVDGEIVALNDRGLPDFRVVAERMHVRSAATARRLATRIPATFMVFDLMRLDGDDLTARPLSERRAILEDLDLGGWQVPATYDDGGMLYDATLAQGLEGIVSKRLDSRYRSGERSPHWVKLAHRHRASYVVGGWRLQTDTHDRLGALLVGEMTPEGLSYRGRVGSGITGRIGRELQALLVPAERSPFVDEVPRVDAQGTTWVAPTVVVDVDTHGLGYERLRQPSFQGVRSDIGPDDLATAGGAR